MSDRPISFNLTALQVPMEEMHVEFLSSYESGGYERVVVLIRQPRHRVFVGPVRAMLPAALLRGGYHHLRRRPIQLFGALPCVPRRKLLVGPCQKRPSLRHPFLYARLSFRKHGQTLQPPEFNTSFLSFRHSCASRSLRLGRDGGQLPESPLFTPSLYDILKPKHNHA